jgi:predicted DsbA family dithiol-disulfide isomerase
MRVDIWSDVVCPWCYIGKRRFEAALAGFEHRDEVELTWHSFQLDPSAPGTTEGDYRTPLARKFGRSDAQVAAMLEDMTQLAAQDGLDYRFDRAHHANTLDAHRLLHLAHEYGVQDEVKERLFQAVFTDGQTVSDHATLRAIGEAAGLDGDEIDAALSSDRFQAEVAADIDQARAYGISGVPFFVIDERYGVSGAQPAAMLRQALEQAWAAEKV